MKSFYFYLLILPVTTSLEAILEQKLAIFSAESQALKKLVQYSASLDTCKLLGPKLIDKTIKTVIDPVYSQKINSSFLSEKSIIAFDTAEHIYQLFMFPQPHSRVFTCTYHAVRNVFYVLYSLVIKKEQFAYWYGYLLSNNLTPFYTLGCKDFIDIQEFRNIIENLQKQHDVTQAVATNTAQHMLFFYSYDPRKINAPGTIRPEITQEFSRKIKLLTALIQRHEKVLRNQATLYAIQAALLYNSDFEALLFHIEQLHTQKDYTFGIVSNTKTAMSHAIGLIVHKCDNIIEYLFLDSLNVPYNYSGPKKYLQKWASHYRISLNTLREFIEHPEILKDAIIRYYYLRFTENQITHKQIVTSLKKLNMLEYPLYTTVYKLAFKK